MPPLETTSNFLHDSDRFEECKMKMKCVLVGDGAVGKTSLVVSYTTNGYPTEYVPTAFDNYSVIVTVDNQPVRLQLCDTAGQDDFDSLRPLCYPGTDIFLLCFSVVSPTSFHNVRDKWLPEIRHHCPGVPVVLVGTQCDLRSDVKVLIELAGYQERPVPESQARRLAEQVGAVSYIESSALTQKNLKEIFDTAILVAMRRRENGGSSDRTRGQRLLGTRNGFVRVQPFGNRPCPAPTVALRHGNVRDSSGGRHCKKGWKKFLCFS